MSPKIGQKVDEDFFDFTAVVSEETGDGSLRKRALGQAREVFFIKL